MPRRDIIDAYRRLDRRLFLDGPTRSLADEDRPLPIGYGQTISQPSLVLEMTLLLAPEAGHRVLELGTGSGYQTALLAPFCAELYSIERLEPLLTRARARLDALGYDNIHYRVGDGSHGWAEAAPFDRILVAAAPATVPPALIEQLAAPGRLVLPVGPPQMQELRVIERDAEGAITSRIANYVAFVELVGDYGWGGGA